MMVVASCISKDFGQQFYPAFYKGAFKDQYFGILVYAAKAENMGRRQLYCYKKRA